MLLKTQLEPWCSQKAAQRLLGKLLAALGPIILDTFVEYLHCCPAVLLADVGLLEMIATLLPNLARRTMQTLTDIVDDLMSGKPRSCTSHIRLAARRLC